MRILSTTENIYGIVPTFLCINLFLCKSILYTNVFNDVANWILAQAIDFICIVYKNAVGMLRKKYGTIFIIL